MPIVRPRLRAGDNAFDCARGESVTLRLGIRRSWDESRVDLTAKAFVWRVIDRAGVVLASVAATGDGDVVELALTGAQTFAVTAIEPRYEAIELTDDGFKVWLSGAFVARAGGPLVTGSGAPGAIEAIVDDRGAVVVTALGADGRNAWDGQTRAEYDAALAERGVAAARAIDPAAGVQPEALRAEPQHKFVVANTGLGDRIELLAAGSFVQKSVPVVFDPGATWPIQHIDPTRDTYLNYSGQAVYIRLTSARYRQFYHFITTAASAFDLDPGPRGYFTRDGFDFGQLLRVPPECYVTLYRLNNEVWQIGVTPNFANSGAASVWTWNQRADDRYDLDGFVPLLGSGSVTVTLPAPFTDSPLAFANGAPTVDAATGKIVGLPTYQSATPAPAAAGVHAYNYIFANSAATPPGATTFQIYNPAATGTLLKISLRIVGLAIDGDALQSSTPRALPSLVIGAEGQSHVSYMASRMAAFRACGEVERLLGAAALPNGSELVTLARPNTYANRTAYEAEPTNQDDDPLVAASYFVDDSAFDGSQASLTAGPELTNFLTLFNYLLAAPGGPANVPSIFVHDQAYANYKAFAGANGLDAADQKARWKACTKFIIATIRGWFASARGISDPTTIPVLLQMLGRRPTDAFEIGSDRLRQAQLELIAEGANLHKGAEVYDMELDGVSAHYSDAGGEVYGARLGERVAEVYAAANALTLTAPVYHGPRIGTITRAGAAITVPILAEAGDPVVWPELDGSPGALCSWRFEDSAQPGVALTIAALARSGDVLTFTASASFGGAVVAFYPFGSALDFHPARIIRGASGKPLQTLGS